MTDLTDTCYSLYDTLGQIWCNPRPVAAAIHSSYRHVISCSSSSSLHITIGSRLTLPSSRTAFSQNYWTHTFQNLWQWQLVEREWPFSGKKSQNTSNMFGLLSKDKDKDTGSSEVYGKCDPLRDKCADNMLYAELWSQFLCLWIIKIKLYLHESERRVCEFWRRGSATGWSVHGKHCLTSCSVMCVG